MSKFLKSNRFDNVKLAIGKNVVETPQGFLKIPAFTARTGIQKYVIDGKIVNEYRSDAEVFSPLSIESLETAAVTDSHPTEMVSPDNAKELMVGFPSGGVKKESKDGEQFLATDLIVTHRTAINAIKGGKAELSNGYHVDLDFTPGEYKGVRYDAQQKNIVNNHIAIVWRARGGKNVRLRLDSADGVLVHNDHGYNPSEYPELDSEKHWHSDPLGGNVSEELRNYGFSESSGEYTEEYEHRHKRPNGEYTDGAKGPGHTHKTIHGDTGESLNNNQKENLTMKLKIDEQEFEVSDEAGKAIKEKMEKLATGKADADKIILEGNAKVDNATTEVEVLKVQKSNLIAKVDGLESDLAKNKTQNLDGDKFDAAVKERISVMDSGRQMLSKDEVAKLDSMSSDEIKKAIIKIDSPEVDEKKLDDAAYVNARFDHIVENNIKSDAAKTKVGTTVVKSREENKDGDKEYVSPEQKRQDSIDKQTEDSLKPISEQGKKAE